MTCKITQLGVDDWPEKAAALIQESVTHFLDKTGYCNLMLTGGRSAEKVYAAWRELPSFKKMNGVRFYFGDERCVPPTDSESNFGMVKKTLFKDGIPSKCKVFPINIIGNNYTKSAKYYESILPERINLILLSLGDDGHIASIFPFSNTLNTAPVKVVPAVCPTTPKNRITITPSVIAMADIIFVIAIGKSKAKILQSLINNQDNTNHLPAKLVLNATWLVDALYTCENI
jgi:6-phosphogluconolactonase